MLSCCRHVKLLRIVVREDLSMPMVDLVSGSAAVPQAIPNALSLSSALSVDMYANTANGVYLMMGGRV